MKFKNNDVELELTVEELRHFKIENSETLRNFIRKLTRNGKRIGFDDKKEE